VQVFSLLEGNKRTCPHIPCTKEWRSVEDLTKPRGLWIGGGEGGTIQSRSEKGRSVKNFGPAGGLYTNLSGGDFGVTKGTTER